MELTQFEVGFPILKIAASVYQVSPRSPTALERILLEICDRFGNDTTYNNISLERIFIDILGVADPGPVVLSTIRELVTLDVLRCQINLESLDILILKHLEVTKRGRQMHSEGMLPAQSQMIEEEFFYDPVRKKLLSALEIKSCRPQPPKIALDSSVFGEVFPEEQIHTHILAGKYPWWNESSQIERVMRQSVVILWWHTPAILTVEQKQLRITFKDGDHTNYVNALNTEEIQRRLLNPTFGIEHYPEKRLANLPLYDFDTPDGDNVIFTPIPLALGDFPGDGRFWIVDRSAAWVPCPDQANTRQAIICFNNSREPGSIDVKWNERRDGCIIDVYGDTPFKDNILSSDKSIIHGRRIRVKVGQDILELAVALRQNISFSNSVIGDSLLHISAALRQHERDDYAIAPAFWQSQSTFWSETLEQISGHSQPLNKILDHLRSTRNRFTEIAGALSPEIWEGVVSKTVCKFFEQNDSPIEYDVFEELVNNISHCGLASSESSFRMMQLITHRLPLPAGLSDFGRVAAAIKKAGVPWKIPFPSRLYTSEVLTAIANDFPGNLVQDSLSNDNKFDNSLLQMIKTTMILNELIGGNGISGLVNEESFIALLKSPYIAKLSAQAELWNKQYDAFIISHPEMIPYIPGSALEKTNECIQKIFVLLSKLFGDKDPRFRRVFVLDTSALLDQPRIMKIFRPDDYIVVSKRVIEELDDKKQDELLRPKVSEVTRALQSFPAHQIQFCDGDMSLLSPDYRIKGDNLILSVAVRFRKHLPILLTNDKNLTLKAKAENIETMSVNDLEKRITQAPVKQI